MRLIDSRTLRAFALFQLFDQLRDDFEQVADDAEVGVLEDRRIGVFVDGDDVLGGLHAREMLHRAGDADGEINIRLDGLAGLADLHGVGHPAGVDCGAAGADGAAEDIGEILEQVELLFALEAAAAGDDDLGAFQLRAFTFDHDPLFHVDFAQAIIRRRRHFFNSQRLRIFFRFEGLRPHD